MTNHLNPFEDCGLNEVHKKCLKGLLDNVQVEADRFQRTTEALSLVEDILVE